MYGASGDDGGARVSRGNEQPMAIIKWASHESHLYSTYLRLLHCSCTKSLPSFSGRNTCLNIIMP